MKTRLLPSPPCTLCASFFFLMVGDMASTEEVAQQSVSVCTTIG